ncbi:methylsterol monooxygenase 2-2 [Senna tora]|uniref:Methylsterol monooxygenase 2-2 n=1 Tax=Senna tora TaxID=362788 RepID=A0A834TLZ1_9FABA|nr:methylsterol monooxygenase 2-2 [Senna tora]
MHSHCHGSPVEYETMTGCKMLDYAFIILIVIRKLAYSKTANEYLISHFSDFQLACLGSFFLHESVFFLSGLPFIWLERAGWLSKYKIQAKNNTPAAQEKCIVRLLLYHFGVNLPVMIFSYPVFRFMGMRSSLPLPSWKVILTQIIFYFILEDFVFYWGHRVLHTKWLYKHVHSVHHEYATPFGLTSEYAHPAEILFLGFATIIGPAITGPHLFTLWLWMVLRVLETVEAHSGYHFPWSLSNFLPLYGGADFHDYHHRLLYTKSGNYSSTFTYMDRIFGTDVGYRKLKSIKNAAVEDISEQKKQCALCVLCLVDVPVYSLQKAFFEHLFHRRFLEKVVITLAASPFLPTDHDHDHDLKRFTRVGQNSRNGGNVGGAGLELGKSPTPTYLWEHELERCLDIVNVLKQECLGVPKGELARVFIGIHKVVRLLRRPVSALPSSSLLYFCDFFFSAFLLPWLVSPVVV